MAVFNPENPFSDPDTSDPVNIQRFFEVESHYRPPRAYSSLISSMVFRAEAVNLIKKYGETIADHVVPYLAVTYFDLCYSSSPKKVDESAENVQNLATSCFVSAWKMRNNTNLIVGYSLFPNKHSLEFSKAETSDIQTLVDEFLDTNNCKRPVTALTFLDFFIGKLPQVEIRRYKNIVTHKLFELQYDVRFIEFKPSVMAAVALILTGSVVYKQKVKYFYDTLISCEHVDSENLERAINLEMPSLRRLPLSPVPEEGEESGMEESVQSSQDEEKPDEFADSLLADLADIAVDMSERSPEMPASEEGYLESSDEEESSLNLKRKKRRLS